MATSKCLTQFRRDVANSLLRATTCRVPDCALLRTRSLSILSLAIVASILGCEPSTRSDDTTVKKRTSHVRTIRVKDMEFLSAKLKEKFLRCDAIARKFARDGWHRRPYKTFELHAARGMYHAEWATFANKSDRNPINYRGPREVHCLSIGAYFDADSREEGQEKIIRGFQLDARWKPAGSGWGARLYYRTFQGDAYPRSKRPYEDFRFSAIHYSQSHDRDSLPSLYFNRAGMTGWADTFQFGGDKGRPPTAYSLFVCSRGSSSVEYQKRWAIIPDTDLKRILDSAETFRDFALRSLDELERRLNVDIPDGTAVKRARYQRQRQLKYAEDPRVLYSKRKLTPGERKQILNKALLQVSKQRAAIRKHYRTIYAAVLRAFPISKCITVGDNDRLK